MSLADKTPEAPSPAPSPVPSLAPSLAPDLLHSLKPRAGSLIVTVYGDAILPRGGEAWLGDLIRLMALFGIGERLVRTAVFRLARNGILAARQVGRRSIYALTEAGRREFDAAQRKIYAPPGAPHAPETGMEAGTPWTIILLTDGIGAGAREALRRELGWSGFGAIGGRVLLGAGAPEQARRIVHSLGLAEHAALFEATRGSAAEPLRALCHEAWGLAETDREYRAFITRFAPLPEALRQLGDDLAGEDAFILRVLMIHAYRRTLLRDPGLPPSLLAEDWSGRAARHLAAEIYGILQYRARDFPEAILEATGGPPSPPPEHFSNRFLRAIGY